MDYLFHSEPSTDAYRMGSKRARTIIATALFCLALTVVGCAGVAVAPPQLLQGNRYPIPVSASQGGREPIATIVIASATIADPNRAPVAVQARSHRGVDLDREVLSFCGWLERTCFTSSGAADGAEDSKTFTVLVSVADQYKGPKGGQVAGGALVHGLTLGLVSLKIDAEFSGSMEVHAQRSDGATKVYTAKAEATGEYQPKAPAGPQFTAVLHETTARCFEQIMTQIKKDSDFWSTR